MPSVAWAARELQASARAPEHRRAHRAPRRVRRPSSRWRAPASRLVRRAACRRSPRAWRCCARATASSPGATTARGIVYALTELADRVAHAAGDDLFAGTFPLVEQPSARIRSMARLFCSEEEDKGWFHDRQQWRDYLTHAGLEPVQPVRADARHGVQLPLPQPVDHRRLLLLPLSVPARPRRLRHPGQGAVGRGARRQPRDAEVHRPRGGAARARLPARALDPALRLRRRAARQLHGRGRDRRQPRALLPRRDHPAARARCRRSPA